MHEFSGTAPLFFCGTSNVVLPVPNKAHFPEEYRHLSRLAYYATLYNSVEVNSSFYKIPLPRTVERWANDVPGHFRFTFKLWKGITHGNGLVYDRADIQRFFSSVNAASGKKGCLLIQFPASIRRPLYARVKALLHDVTASAHGWDIAVEFRDASWYNDTVYEMLDGYGSTVVMHDMPASRTPVIDMDASCAYIRFHGEEGRYRGSYSDEDLRDQAAHIATLLSAEKNVYAYLNNTLGAAALNALTLRDMVDGSY